VGSAIASKAPNASYPAATENPINTRPLTRMSATAAPESVGSAAQYINNMGSSRAFFGPKNVHHGQKSSVV
jgi:hypothetical protein